MHRDLTRYIPVHTVKVQCSAFTEVKYIILSVYYLNGCDTGSSFCGKGKRKAFQVMCKAVNDLKKSY
jgi:hypothetical protein